MDERFAVAVESLQNEPFAAEGAVAHARVELDAVLHVVHHAGFGDHGFAGIEFHLDDLQIIPQDFVIDFVALHGPSP